MVAIWPEATGKIIMSYPKLYIFMRTDMKSLNTGKAMAQAAHAANLAILECKKDKHITGLVDEWEKQGDGFGTTIVYNGDNLEFAKGVISEMDCNMDLIGWKRGIVLDRTYPIEDGPRKTHFLPIETCLWLFGDSADILLTSHLEKFTLHE